jgi:threonine dehydrogenase-like Zn-dependent dehydrogenase
VKYIQFAGNSLVKVRERPVPDRAPGEVSVQIALSAICGSEMHAYETGIPSAIIPMHNSGHEMVGIVAEVDEGCGYTVGQRVGINIMKGCGECYYCLQGDLVHCVDLKYGMDAHSEYVVMPESCMVPLPDDLDWEAAVLLCGDTLGTPYHGLKRLGGVTAAETAAVFGFGPIGIGCLVWLKYFGLRTIVSELSPYRRELAKRLGADLVLDPAEENVVERVKAETGGGADVCLDCAPVAQTLNDALDAAKIYGRVGFIAEKREATIKPSEQVIRKELSMAGAWYFTNAEVVEQIEHYRRGLSLDGIITHRYTLDQATEAYKKFHSGETGKVVFTRPGLT